MRISGSRLDDKDLDLALIILEDTTDTLDFASLYAACAGLIDGSLCLPRWSVDLTCEHLFEEEFAPVNEVIEMGGGKVVGR